VGAVEQQAGVGGLGEAALAQQVVGLEAEGIGLLGVDLEHLGEEVGELASALGGALVAEFIASNDGMGQLISTYTGNLNMASAFVCVLTLSAIGFFIMRGMEALDRWLVFWNDRHRTEAMGRTRAAAWGLRKEKGARP
jgi:hypothetical protein